MDDMAMVKAQQKNMDMGRCRHQNTLGPDGARETDPRLERRSGRNELTHWNDLQRRSQGARSRPGQPAPRRNPT